MIRDRSLVGSAPQPLHRLFLHYFDRHFLHEQARRADAQKVVDEARLATRFAVLAAKEVFLPASSYFETPICRTILDELTPILDAGVITLVGTDPSIDAFVHAKMETYDPGGFQYNLYLSVVDGDDPLPPFRQRQHSSTQDIIASWIEVAAQPRFEAAVFGEGLTSLLPKGIGDLWNEVPQKLGGRAFTPEYVDPLLFSAGANRVLSARVAGVINTEYFRSFSSELQAGFVGDLIQLNAHFELSDRWGNLPYRAMLGNFRDAGLLDGILTASASDLLAMRRDARVMEILRSSLEVPINPRGVGSKLEVHLDLTEEVTNLRTIPVGADHADRYQRVVAAILDQLFQRSFPGGADIEQRIHEGRKRLDISWRNYATDGVFNWLANRHYAKWVYAECKNYKRDLKNPEVDQLIARFNPNRTTFGFLLYRSVQNRPLLIRRCRDAFSASQGLVVPLGDDDIELLSKLGPDDGPKDPQTKFLNQRIEEITS